jgi:formylglycine-generating enzyme required for sulfatase activity
MGTPGATDDETPVDVTLTRGFWIARTETTQAQWAAVMLSFPWIEHGADGTLIAGDSYPAIYVDHEQASEFCFHLTETLQHESGLRFALPTEAQWEYACRAGTTTAYSFGGDVSKLGDFGWFDGNVDSLKHGWARIVMLKEPNPWGLHDMHGNVWEWCRDWHGSLRGGLDPTGSLSGAMRVLRGGSWFSGATDARSTNRAKAATDFSGPAIGFRVVAE